MAGVAGLPLSAAPLGETTTLRGVPYLGVRAFGRRVGFTSGYAVGALSATLTDGRRSMVLEADSREATLDGLSLYLGDPVARHRGYLWLSVTDAERFLGPILKPSLAPGGRPARPRLVCLDAGHGGRDPGTMNTRLALREKELVLAVSREAQRRLVALGKRVLMTRTDDRFIELEARAAAANRAGADLFISVHLNATSDARVGGTETYILTPRGQRSTNVTQSSSLDLASLPGNRMDGWNAVLGYRLHQEVVGKLGLADRGLRRARFAVLRGLACPGALVESAYLSNEREARRARTAEFQADLAQAVVAAVVAYEKDVSGA